MTKIFSVIDEEIFSTQKIETTNLLKPMETAINVNDSMSINNELNSFINNSYQETFYEENVQKNGSLDFTGDENEELEKNVTKKDVISMEHVSSILGCHCSDLRLILNVASVYSPIVLSSAM